MGKDKSKAKKVRKMKKVHVKKHYQVGGIDVIVQTGASIYCQKCGRKLKSEESITNGIGPCCRKKVPAEQLALDL